MRRGAVLISGLLLAGSCGEGGQQGERLARSMNLPMTVGQICGDPAVLGEVLAPIEGGGSCGIDAPVAVHAVGQVRLSRPAQLNCAAARALSQWVETGAAGAAEQAGTRIASLEVAGSYACRRQNNRPQGKLSEHAKGNAIDISAVTFANGERATVLGDWSRGRHSPVLQRMHAAACGPFGVVLGPGADQHHKDHLHFDVSNRDRPYCR